MSWLDLHMHSNISDDGDFSPEELVRLCAEANIKTMALTDHNSMRGVERTGYYAKASGITLIPAIELDCTFEDVNLHVLGYGIDITNSLFSEIEANIEKQEQNATMTRMRLTSEIGFEFNFEDVLRLSKNGVVTGEMIAEIVLNDSRNKNNPLLSAYYNGGKRSDNPYVNFYWDFCSKGKQAYVPIVYISLAEAIELIRKSGGIAVLAHPGNNIGTNAELLSQIIGQGIAGVEVYSSYHDEKTTLFYKAQAEALGIIKTVGSDFHGKTKPAIKLGGVFCDNLEDEISASLLNCINYYHR